MYVNVELLYEKDIPWNSFAVLRHQCRIGKHGNFAYSVLVPFYLDEFLPLWNLSLSWQTEYSIFGHFPRLCSREFDIYGVMSHPASALMESHL